ncbi:MAG TPA: protein phosphatase 2C domain-containing protein [Solirubrobacteraceae bacterium]|nr:protein phosphatase 2C domain-containing protein [Solirubrobacteraceae bacterium]
MIGDPSPHIEPRLAGGDPYRGDTLVDGGLAFGLTVRAASVRGLAKRWAGGPRQDDVCLGLHEPTRTLVAAVADGVSGAARSQLGAALAVRHAVAAVTRQLDAGTELDWGAVFAQASWALVEAHRAASGDPQAGPEQAAASLATTLLVAAISQHAEEPPAAEPPAAISQHAEEPPAEEPQAEAASAAGVSAAEVSAAEVSADELSERGSDGGRPAGEPCVSAQLASVGDSCALLLADWRFTQVQGDGPSERGLIGGPVRALPRAASELSATRLKLAPGEVLLLASDGFALPLAGGEGEVGAVFARELHRPPALLDFARMLDFSRSTYDDDRTLVAIWPPREC